MNKFTFGNGNLVVYKGRLESGLGNRCLLIEKTQNSRPIGSKIDEEDSVIDESEIDLIIDFKNIESARVLQDELNELISVWSKEEALIVKK